MKSNSGGEEMKNKKNTGNAPTKAEMMAAEIITSNVNPTTGSNDEPPRYSNGFQMVSLTFQSMIGETDASTDDRLINVLMVYLTVLGSYIIVYVVDIHLFHTISLYMAIAFIHWFVAIIKILLTSDRIHTITVKNHRVEGYGINTIPIDITHNRFRCVLSISELSGVRGSLANYKILTSLIIVTVLISISIVIKWHLLTEDDFDNIKINDVMILFCLFLTSFGMALVTTFEINGYDKKHEIIHYIGALLVTSVGVALIIQCNYNVISVITFCFSLSIWIFWFVCVTFYYQETYPDDEQKVNDISKQSIWIELFAWVVVAVVLCFVIWGLD